MTKLLDHPLIRKYFSCDAMEIRCPNGNEQLEHMALRVLEAMSEDIHDGDLYLNYLSGLEWVEVKWSYAQYIDGYHPYRLKLPPPFQKRDDPVEAKIEEIAETWDRPEMYPLRMKLKELVAIVRKHS
jgi:hypothetical protein